MADSPQPTYRRWPHGRHRGPGPVLTVVEGVAAMLLIIAAVAGALAVLTRLIIRAAALLTG